MLIPEGSIALYQTVKAGLESPLGGAGFMSMPPYSCTGT